MLPVRAVAALLATPLIALALASPAQAASRVPRLDVTGRQALSGDYERVFGIVRGQASPDERVAGLPRTGLSYTAEFELVRPRAGSEPARAVLVEAENRGSPLLLRELEGLGLSAGGSPSAISYPEHLGGAFLRPQRLAYARVQWQTGIAAGVPAGAQGVGEVIVRDFGRALRRRYPRRVLIGVSQGAFFIDSLIAEGFNRDPSTGGRVYGSAFTLNGAGNWLAINQLARGRPQEPYLVDDAAPLSPRRLLRRPRSDPFLVDVAAYTDFYRLRAGLTDALGPAGRRVRYDWPAAHQQFGPEIVFEGFGCNDRTPVALNLIDPAPYVRALLAGMVNRRLAPSRRFELGPTPRTSPRFNGLPGKRVPVPRVDEDGRPRGGIRFPEVEVPLGRLDPVSLPPVTTRSIAEVCGNSGGFTPFGRKLVRRRYPTVDAYVDGYSHALSELIAQGFVLRSERAAMLRAARMSYRAAAGAG